MSNFWKEYAQPEEKKFLEHILGVCARAQKQNRCLATDFYTREWMIEVIVKYLGNVFLNECKFYGGYEMAERVCLLFGYEAYYEDSIPVGFLQIKVQTGIGKALTHRDYLGALLGLGIERHKIGDLLVKADGAFLIIDEALTDFVEIHFRQVARYEINEIKIINAEEIIPDPPQVKIVTGTVPSLRADAVFGLAFGMSRSSVVKLLQSEKGKRNGMIVKVADLLIEGDILTLKGYGKVKFKEVSGQTKKERYHISLEKYV